MGVQAEEDGMGRAEEGQGQGLGKEQGYGQGHRREERGGVRKRKGKEEVEWKREGGHDSGQVLFGRAGVGSTSG